MSFRAPPLSYPANFRATLYLGVPLIGSLMAQTLVNLTDTVMVGWYGLDSLAAVVLATSVFFVFFIVGSGFAMAVMPMAAAAEGAGEQHQVRRVVRMGLWISVIYCAVMMAVLWNFSALLQALGQKPKIADLAQDYMRIGQWGMFPGMLMMVLKSYLSALERPGWIIWATLLGAVGNAVFNYAFIFGHWGAPEMGVRGAAIASVFTGVVTFLVLAIYAQYNRHLKEYAIFTRIWRSDWPAFWEVFRLGWPIGATMLAEVGMFSASAIMMGWIGTRELATHGIAVQIASIAFMVYLGMANATTIRVGQALGRRNREGIRRAALVLIAIQLSSAAVMIVVLLSFPASLISLFLDAENPDRVGIITYGTGLLVVAAAFQVVDGLQVAGLNILRGLKDTRVPMLGAVVSYWAIGMPVSYVLGFKFGFGGYGIWGGLVVGLACAAVLMMWRFAWLIKRIPAD